MNNIFKKVFLWMMIGLLVTFATGYTVATNPNMIEKIFSTSLYIILPIIEIILVIVLSARITKMNPTTARILFILYSFVTGLTFSSIFIIYEMTSIIFVFLITAIVFGILSLIGYTTKVDLTKLGTYSHLLPFNSISSFVIKTESLSILLYKSSNKIPLLLIYFKKSNTFSRFNILSSLSSLVSKLPFTISPLQVSFY